MNYQVLARQYRPSKFSEVVGQDAIVKALSHALNQNRLHHAYLFTGTHGIGKTTLGRLFAKSLSCQSGITATPCDTCTHCTAIDKGTFPDFFEIDAASRTKVEDTRELLEQLKYAPASGRFKIYLIDEVHMLSGHSFNALLKTLEEPPSHVKFLLATTDHQKLPATVLSRCLQFHLHPVSPSVIDQHLATVLEQEKINFEPAALPLLSQAANGSLRDALSLLDQSIAYGDGHVLLKDVRTLLGVTDQSHLLNLLTALSNRDGATIYTIIERLERQGTQFYQALTELTTILHHINLVQVIPDAVKNTRSDIQALAAQLSAEDIQLFYQIAVIGRRDFNSAPTPRIGFEMTVLRMLAFYPDTPGAYSAQPSAPTQSNTYTAHPRTAQPTADNKNTASENNNPSDWHSICHALALTGAAHALARNCSLTRVTEDHVYLSIHENQRALMIPRTITRLNEALSSYYKRPITAQIETGTTNSATPALQAQQQQQQKLQKANNALRQDPGVQTIMEKLNATIMEGSNTNHDDH